MTIISTLVKLGFALIYPRTKKLTNENQAARSHELISLNKSYKKLSNTVHICPPDPPQKNKKKKPKTRAILKS